MLFICGIYGQGSNRNKIIFGCVIGGVAGLLIACIAIPCIKSCRKKQNHTVAIEYQGGAKASENAAANVSSYPMRIDFDQQGVEDHIRNLLTDMRTNKYGELQRRLAQANTTTEGTETVAKMVNDFELDRDCAICQKIFSPEEQVFITECTHIFH